MTFTDHDLTVISNALRVAAERFKEHANAIVVLTVERERLSNQFRRQADEALALHDRIAEETGVAS